MPILLNFSGFILDPDTITHTTHTPAAETTRGSGSPCCCCVCSGLSPCKLPSDPRLSMRELIMADGPRCKRRKQANPRRKNGKSGLGKCPGAVRKRTRYAGRREREMRPDRSESRWEYG
ncbi:hypothetical protein Q8A67_014131 [Cirrhinus molitorella]|uniref:Uncharacterized protein n=1 Tax=Cirrhinus molitorella TaxID=172907 RepID=A0AA88PL51_9TELE|nr:hypothetical protein Q8A67_014131 [Cirrhinus molitorella]